MICGRNRVDKWRRKCGISAKWQRPRRVRTRDVVIRQTGGSSNNKTNMNLASGVKTAGPEFSEYSLQRSKSMQMEETEEDEFEQQRRRMNIMTGMMRKMKEKDGIDTGKAVGGFVKCWQWFEKKRSVTPP